MRVLVLLFVVRFYRKLTVILAVVVHQPVVQVKSVRMKPIVTVPSPKGSAPEKEKCNSNYLERNILWQPIGDSGML